MSNLIIGLNAGVRRGIAGWIDERPATVVAVAGLGSGNGRVWIDGDPATPAAVLIESTLVPGEAQGFGDGASLVRLLEQANGWSCVEVDSRLTDSIGDDFEHPDRTLAAAAAEHGRFFAAVEHGMIIGHGGGARCWFTLR